MLINAKFHTLGSNFMWFPGSQKKTQNERSLLAAGKLCIGSPMEKPCQLPFRIYRISIGFYENNHHGSVKTVFLDG